MKDGWEIKKFENCIGKIPKPQQLKTSEYKLEGRYPIVSQESSIISGYTDYEDYVYHIPKPIVIFGDHTRVLKYVDFDFAVGADGVKILIPTNDINSKFFYYFLRWYNVPSLGYSRHYKLLKDIHIPVPPLPEQEKIVSELDCLSGIIEKKRQQLKELDVLAQSIFYEMFGNPVDNEKGWEVKAIKDVAPQQVYKGGVPCVEGKYWLLNLDVIASNTGEVLEKCYFDISEIGSSTITFNEDNVLYSKLRPYLNKVVIPDGVGYATSELVPLHPNKKVLDKVFLSSLLRSTQFVSYISNKVAGAKMPRVSMNDFRTFPVILPPLPLQQSFAQKIESIEQQKTLIKQSIAEVETLFNSRMDYYFN